MSMIRFAVEQSKLAALTAPKKPRETTTDKILKDFFIESIFVDFLKNVNFQVL